jgi:hypothetical protein
MVLNFLTKADKRLHMCAVIFTEMLDHIRLKVDATDEGAQRVESSALQVSSPRNSCRFKQAR